MIADESQVEIDHIKEIGAGGDPWDQSNWQIACRICNRRKKARPTRRNPTNRNVPPWMIES